MDYIIIVQHDIPSGTLILTSLSYLTLLSC